VRALRVQVIDALHHAEFKRSRLLEEAPHPLRQRASSAPGGPLVSARALRRGTGGIAIW